jgi:hypothetical protein
MPLVRSWKLEGSSEMDANFLRILGALANQGVEFVVVGGIAANFHGSALATFDCDVAIDLDSDNLQKMAKALAILSPTFRGKNPPILFDEDMALKGGWKNIYLNTSAGILDCLGEIKGLGGYEVCRENSVEAELGDFSVRFLSREALITAKKAMGRPKDLLTVAHLEVGSEFDEK